MLDMSNFNDTRKTSYAMAGIFGIIFEMVFKIEFEHFQQISEIIENNLPEINT